MMVDPSLLFSEYFDGGVSNTWPPAWTDLGGLLNYEVDGDGRGRLEGELANVGRIGVPGLSEVDVEVVLTVTFDDWNTQGMGIYVRQNGGWLTNTVPPGEGYAVFLEGDGLDAIGIWREIDGIEIEMHSEVPPPIVDGVAYRLRFGCLQSGGVTQLRAKIWPALDSEPLPWNVVHFDDTAVLQNQPGTFAIDMYNYSAPLGIYLDDIEVRTLP